MSVSLDPNKPDFEESRWITSEDVNIEHLLDVFTTIDANSDVVWEACVNFTNHLRWHKGRLTILGPRIEKLPDDHRSKPECLYELSWLFDSVGDLAERKRLLTRALVLWRERGNDKQAARVLSVLSYSNWRIGLYEEGMQQAREALEIYEFLGDAAGLAICLTILASSLERDGQLGAAEETASRAINLHSEKGDRFMVCHSHRVLGNVYRSKGEIEKAVHHYEATLSIASSFNWHNELFWTHYDLAELFHDKGRFDDASAHVERAKPHTENNAYHLGRAVNLQATVWYKQDRLEEAKSEALRAADVFEKLGAVANLEDCRELLRWIEEKMNPVISGQSRFTCGLLQMIRFPACIDFPFWL